MQCANKPILVLSGPARRGGHADVLLGELLDSTDSYEYESDSDLEDEEEGLDALGSLLATPSEISVEKEVEDKLVCSDCTFCSVLYTYNNSELAPNTD